MSAEPYVVGAAAAVIVALRLRRVVRRRRQAQPRPPGRRARWIPDLGDTGLVAARELRERLRGRYFTVVTLVLLAVVGASIVIPAVRSHRAPAAAKPVGVVGTLTARTQAAVVAAAAKAGTPVRLVDEPSLSRARAELAAGRLAMVIDGERSILVATAPTPTNVTAAVSAVARTLGAAAAERAAGLTPAQSAALAHAAPLPVRGLKSPAGSATARTTSLIGLVLVFIMLTQYLTWTLTGVLEEKTSRVVEVLLAAVRPGQLLGGKVLGIGAVAMLQAALVVAFALVLADVVGSDLLHGTAPMVLVVTLVWLVLGYAFYSWVYAAAGSMVARQDQVQSLALPLSVPIIVSYVVALTAAGPASPSALVQVFAYLPPTASFAMPVLVAHDAAQWWQVVLSGVLSVGATVAVARVAAVVYRRAVLRTGRRVSLREVLAAAR